MKTSRKKSVFFIVLLVSMAIIPAQAQLVLHKETTPKQAEQYIRSILSREAHHFKQLDRYGNPPIFSCGQK